ncbi:MAG: hypothetical protein ACTHL3_05990, partial [Candidatus Nitrosocosmicus sp.]
PMPYPTRLDDRPLNRIFSNDFYTLIFVTCIFTLITSTELIWLWKVIKPQNKYIISISIYKDEKKLRPCILFQML